MGYTVVDAPSSAPAAAPAPGGYTVADAPPQSGPVVVNPADFTADMSAGPSELLRQLGLTGRYVVQGLAGITDPVNRAIAGVQSLLGVEPENRLKNARDVTATALSNAGLPTPQTPTERVVGDISEALTQAGAIGGPGAAAMRGGEAGSTVANVGDALASNQAAQAAGAASGAGASGVAREAGLSPEAQMIVGLLSGFGVPAAGMASAGTLGSILRGSKAYARGFTKAGQNEMAGVAGNQFAADAPTAIENMQNAPEYVPGSQPTAAQAASDPGLLALESTIRGTPEFGPAYAAQSAKNNAARLALLGVPAEGVPAGAVSDFGATAGAGTPDMLEAAIAARRAAADRDYGNVSGPLNLGPGLGPLPFQRAGDTVSGLTVRDSVPNQSSIGASFSDYHTHPGVYDVPFSAVGPELPPAQKAAWAANLPDRTKTLASQIADSGEINPLIVARRADGSMDVIEGSHRFDALDSLGHNSFPAMVVDDLDDVPGVSGASAKLDTLMDRPSFKQAWTKAENLAAEANVPPEQMTLSNPTFMHYIKLGFDDLLDTATPTSGIGKTQQRAIVGTKNDFLDTLDALSPAYGTARANFAAASGPINRMQTLQDIFQRAQMAAPDTLGNPVLSQAKFKQQGLSNADDLAQQLTPTQSEAMGNIQSDLDRASLASSVRPPGSDTFRNFATTHALGEGFGALGDNPLAKIATRSLSLPYKWGGVNESVANIISDAMLDPAKMSALMAAAPRGMTREGWLAALGRMTKPLVTGGAIGTVSQLQGQQ